MAKTTKSDLQSRVRKLEKRVSELEARQQTQAREYACVAPYLHAVQKWTPSSAIETTVVCELSDPKKNVC